MLDGKTFRLADEVRYILRRAAEHDGRVVTIGILFSTETGDAWLLDPSDQLAARLARDGDPEPFHIEESETTFTIDWKGRYRIEGATFVHMDRETGRLATIQGYPTRKLTKHEGKSWLVPSWETGPTEVTLRPTRMICLTGFPVGKSRFPVYQNFDTLGVKSEVPGIGPQFPRGVHLEVGVARRWAH